MAATVTARGVAVAPATPDEGIWIVTMSALDASPDAALEEVGSRSAELQALLGELDVPSEKRSSSGVSVREEYEWDEGKQTHGGYLASNSVTVRLEDPAVAGRLIQGAIGRAKASVHGPAWWIAPNNDARIEACRQATLEARRKAEAYADALGFRLGAVAEIREPTGPIAGRALSGFRPLAAAGEPPLDVDPGELQVHAAVEVTFFLESETPPLAPREPAVL